METCEKFGMKLMKIKYSKAFKKIMTNGFCCSMNFVLKRFFKQIFT